MTYTFNVGCGRCVFCLSKKANDWTFRLDQQRKHSTDCYFITLTYDNDHLPHHSNGKHEVQKFIKRFRKNNDLVGKGFKYYLIAELGGEFGRLHYHAIFFNTGLSWNALRTSLLRDWRKGMIRVNVVTPGRIKYVSKYCLQHMYKPKPKYEFRTYDTTFGELTKRVKIKPINYFFMVCSKGLGIDFVTDSIRAYLVSNMKFSIPQTKTINGHVYVFERPLPSYYLPKVYIDDEKLQELKELRLEYAQQKYCDDEEERNEYYRARYRCYRFGLEPPERPSSWQERDERARRIQARMKKYKFEEPPEEDWW